MTPALVTRARRFAAPPERVFDAFLDPALAGRFLFATPAGEMVRVEIEARVGGRYAIVERRDGAEVEHAGRYLELERPRRLLFTLAVPRFPAEEARVAIDIAPAAGGCGLILTHALHPDWADAASRVEAGRAAILERLGAVISDQ